MTMLEGGNHDNAGGRYPHCYLQNAWADLKIDDWCLLLPSFLLTLFCVLALR